MIPITPNSFSLFPDKKNPACRKADGAVSLFLLCVSAGELIHHPLPVSYTHLTLPTIA